MAKPSSHLDWTDGAASKVEEPGAAKKLLGWISDERPPFKFMNWLFFRADEWIQYFEGVTDTLLTQQPLFDAYVAASGGTHTTLAAALADAGIVADSRIAVLDAEALGTTVAVTKNGIEIVFHPRATFSDSGAGTGIQIQADRVKVFNGRFTGFTTGVQIDAAKKNCRVQNCNFSAVTNDIVDNGTNNLLSGNMVEA